MPKILVASFFLDTVYIRALHLAGKKCVSHSHSLVVICFIKSWSLNLSFSSFPFGFFSPPFSFHFLYVRHLHLLMRLHGERYKLLGRFGRKPAAKKTNWCILRLKNDTCRDSADKFTPSINCTEMHIYCLPSTCTSLSHWGLGIRVGIWHYAPKDISTILRKVGDKYDKAN